MKEWCPRCQKYVEVWSKGSLTKQGSKVIKVRTDYCRECKMFLKSEREERVIYNA